jgi:hypothetical protein
MSSLLPSSSAVSECLARLRAEKASADPFRAAVAAASIQWEAELLLALEEFKRAGGFVGIQDELRLSIRRERLLSAAKDGKAAPLDVPCHWSFLHEGFDVKIGLLTVTEHTVCVRSGPPTMASERAALRIRILAAVIKELREAVTAKVDAEDEFARTLACANAQYKLVVEEKRAVDRVLVP